MVIRSVAFVCLCVCLVRALTFKSPGLEISFLVRRYIFTIFEFVCQGHRVKVKVTWAKGQTSVTRYTQATVYLATERPSCYNVAKQTDSQYSHRPIYHTHTTHLKMQATNKSNREWWTVQMLIHLEDNSTKLTVTFECTADLEDTVCDPGWPRHGRTCLESWSAALDVSGMWRTYLDDRPSSRSSPVSRRRVITWRGDINTSRACMAEDTLWDMLLGHV